MTWAFVAVAVGAIIVGGVAAHDIEVKKNRAIGAAQAAAKEQQEAIDADKEDVQLNFAEDAKRRRENILRINPTGSKGIDDDSPLRRQADNFEGRTATTSRRGRGRLLGS